MSLKDCSGVCALADQWCDTTVRIHKTSCIWTIENFDFYEAEGSSLYFPEFSAVSNNVLKWKLQLKPNGETESKDTISLYLQMCRNSPQKVYAKFDVSVLNSRHEKMFTSKGNISEFDQEKHLCWGRKEFLKKDNKFRSLYLIDNKLTIMIDLSFSLVRNAVNSTLHQCEKSLLYPDVPACNLSENFGRLLEQGELTDVVLSVEGQEYPAHKNILAARSPVFAALFKHGMKENELNRVDIEDMNSETVVEFLKYVYTGKCENLKTVTESLLAAADKYGVDRLKIACAEALYETLSVQNAANILILADMHSVKELKSESIKFIVANFIEVFNSTVWKNSVVTHPHVANEVYQALSLQSATGEGYKVVNSST